MAQRLILASASPRRIELLTQIGVHAEVHACDVPELRQAGESALAYSRRVARAKAVAGWQLGGQERDCWALGADTEVVLDDCVYGKPVDAADAARMLRQLAGREHQVLTSVALIGAASDEVVTCVTAVQFAPLSDAQIGLYVDSGEPFGKAGAYAIQGRAATFIARIEGSYSGVMGLPLFETATLLRRAGCIDLF